MADESKLEDGLVRRLWARAVALCSGLTSSENAKIREETLLQAADQMVAEGFLDEGKKNDYLAEVKRVMVFNKFKDLGMSEPAAKRAMDGANHTRAAWHDRIERRK